MFKVFFFFSLFYIASGDLRNLEGSWTNLVVYPNKVYIPYCQPITLINEHKTTTCKCGDEDFVFSIYRRVMDSFYLPSLGSTTDAVNDTLIVQVADDSEEVNRYLNLNCDCGSNVLATNPLMVYKFLEDNYVVQYMNLHSEVYTVGDPNTAHLLARELSSKEELRRVMGAAELKDRQPGFMCENLK